jgi:hypothetical protein
LFIEEGQRGAEFRSIATNVGSTSLLEEPQPDSWGVTMTCHILRDTDERITTVSHAGGPSVPEIDQAVSTMVGKVLRRYAQPTRLELEISLK